MQREGFETVTNEAAVPLSNKAVNRVNTLLHGQDEATAKRGVGQNPAQSLKQRQQNAQRKNNQQQISNDELGAIIANTLANAKDSEPVAPVLKQSAFEALNAQSGYLTVEELAQHGLELSVCPGHPDLHGVKILNKPIIVNDTAQVDVELVWKDGSSTLFHRLAFKQSAVDADNTSKSFAA